MKQSSRCDSKTTDIPNLVDPNEKIGLKSPKSAESFDQNLIIQTLLFDMKSI